jgi:hypothetical protein
MSLVVFNGSQFAVEFGKKITDNVVCFGNSFAKNDFWALKSGWAPVSQRMQCTIVRIQTKSKLSLAILWNHLDP